MDLLAKEFDWLELQAAPQVKTTYGLFIYQKEVEVIAKGSRGKKGLTTTSYKKVNRKPYKNVTWLNRMYDRRKTDNAHTTIFKVVLPLEFPDGYKLYDEKGEYYGTVLGRTETEMFLYILPRKNKYPELFQTKRMDRFYIQSQDEKYGLTVPFEFYKDCERIG